MSIRNLPNELLLRIAWFVLKCPTCHCHHVSRHLSALARSNWHLYALLTPELLRAASSLHILLWAVAHGRPDIVTLAINLGANPNIPLRETRRYGYCTERVRLGTSVEIALRMCIRSRDTTTSAYQLKLDITMMLPRAGGKPTIESLSIIADSGDLDLLELCLPYITDIDERDKPHDRTLLEVAGAKGHIRCVTRLLAAGATVNSTGGPDDPDYYPPLWTICDAPLPVLQLLLDAGADAAWEHAGLSIVAHLIQTHGTRPDVDAYIDLLAWHGSRLPKGEEAIALWQAPVWESWTAGGQIEVDVEQATTELMVAAAVVEQVRRIDRVSVHRDENGWELVVSGNWDEWGPMSLEQGLNWGCVCPECPLWKTGGNSVVRAVA